MFLYFVSLATIVQGGGLVVWSFVAVHIPQQLIWRIHEQLIRLHELSQGKATTSFHFVFLPGQEELFRVFEVFDL
jgi:hypothetical protein